MYKQGFLKVASVSPQVRSGDPNYNVKKIIKSLEKLEGRAAFACFPELAISGYTVADMLYQDYLYEATNDAIKYLLDNNPYSGVIIIGSYYKLNDCLYNCSFVIQGNKVLGIVPKKYLPHTEEFAEARWFNSSHAIQETVSEVSFLGKVVPFGKIIFTDEQETCKFGVEICADLWSPYSPHNYLYANGAMIVFNNSTSNEYVGKDKLRVLLANSASYKWNGAYVYSSTGASESSSEVVFSGHRIISVNGEVVEEDMSFLSDDEITYGDIDLNFLHYQRRKNAWFKLAQDELRDYDITVVNYELSETKEFDFAKEFDKYPFVPKTREGLQRIVDIQAAALYKRLDFAKLDKVVIGISGGLDSTLALLSTVYAFDKYGLERKNIIGVTLPTNNTSKNTLEIAQGLMRKLSIDSRLINIEAEVAQALSSINHDGETKDITYENAQARYRTYLLMNIANLEKGLVLGTADMSEIALGWQTFGGDHMAMYALNSGLAKTTVKAIIDYYKTIYSDLDYLLNGVLNLEISPELTSENQKTEETLGKYKINDFIMHRFLICGDEPDRIVFLLEEVFKLPNQEANWYVDNFYNRFFSQQFKRQSMPEGVKILDLSLSPRSQIKLGGDTYFKR